MDSFWFQGGHGPLNGVISLCEAVSPLTNNLSMSVTKVNTSVGHALIYLPQGLFVAITACLTVAR